MIFRNSITELSFYNTPQGAPCYCEQLTYAADLTLQAPLASNFTSGYTLQVDVYTPDGLTLLEDATTYFQFYVAQNPVTGTKFFNLQLKGFSPEMCSNACWILRVRFYVGGQTIFDKFTDKYCMSACCDIPRNISISQDAVVQNYAPGWPSVDDADNPDPGTPATPTDGDTPILASPGPCDVPMIRIVVMWPCYDPTTGLFYGTPTTVYTGTANFALSFILNLPGRIVQRPRAISRTISFNCRTQLAESARIFLLEGKTEASLLPAWKMDELEGAFHAPEIWVDGDVYQWDGGTALRQITDCWELFKLETQLRKCFVRVYHGCDTPCGPVQELDFVVPGYYMGNGYYDQDRVPFDNLTNYLNGQTNVASVTDVTADYPDASLALRAVTTGPIQAFVYFDFPRVSNRVFGAAPDTTSAVIPCAVPVIGTITDSDLTCETPTIGTITDVEQPGDDGNLVIPINSWNDYGDGSTVRSASGVGHLTLSLQSSVWLPGDSDVEAEDYKLNNVPIAQIYGPAVPRTAAVLWVEPGDTGRMLMIDGNGVVTFSGQPTNYEYDGGGDVILSYINVDLYYNT